MVKALLGLFLVLCGLGIPAWSLPASDSSGMTTVAQDSTGTVWALPADGGNEGVLRHWQSGAWVTQAVPEAAGFRPYLLTRGGDGAVYAFWQRPTQRQPQSSPWQPLPWQRPPPAQPPSECLVTVQRRTVSQILTRFSGATIREQGPASVATLRAGSEGDVWLADDLQHIRRITRDGGREMFPFTREQFFQGGPGNAAFLPEIDSVVDGIGRRWFWQGGASAYWRLTGLRGVLVWDGITQAYHATLTGVPDRPLSLIAPLDKNHLWLAVDAPLDAPSTRSTLYRLDTRTLSAVPVSQPQPGAFQNVMQIFQANGDWYVVARQPNRFTDSLWRCRAGHWQDLVNGLSEVDENNVPAARHPWLAEPTGVWLGDVHGVWWLPRSDVPPLLVDWRRGLSTHGVTGLYPLSGGGILAVGVKGETQMAATPQPTHSLPPEVVTGGMGAPTGIGPLIADPRRHLWGTPTYYTGPCPLDEWDGRRWRTYLPPKTLTGITGLHACDTLGRLWLTTSHWDPPTQPQPVEGRAVYDPAHDTWTSYETVADALRAAATLAGMRFLSYRNAFQVPLFSGDGRVTYAYNTTVFLYDGQTWRHWEARDIQPGYNYGNLGDQPHFNPNGHLEIVLSDQSWEWTPENGWQRSGLRTPEKYQYPVPPGGPRGLEGLPVVDSLGAKWFTWQGAVYTAWHGLWAKQDALSSPGSPFKAGYGLEDVLCDPLGRLFLVARPAGYYDLVVWSPSPVLKPMLSLVPAADDAVTVRVHVKQRGRHWILWRLNGGVWNPPQAADTLRLTALPHGDYRLEVQVLDDHLQPSPSASAVFSIRVASDVQVSRWVRALLDGTNAQREAAVAGLVKQPDAALSALRAVPDDLPASARWWVDAAIQQVQAQKP